MTDEKQNSAYKTLNPFVILSIGSINFITVLIKIFFYFNIPKILLLIKFKSQLLKPKCEISKLFLDINRLFLDINKTVLQYIKFDIIIQ